MLRQRIGRGIGSESTETLLLRIGLVGAGALLLRMSMHVAISAPLADVPAYVVAVIALGGLGLATLVAAGWRIPSTNLRWLILLAVVSEIVLTATIWRQTQRLNPFSSVDVALYNDMASELVQRGENPYTWDYNNVHQVYRISEAASTPQLDGSVTERHPYPSLSFLVVLPFDIVGLPGVWLVPILAQITLACLLFLAAPRTIQPLILLPLIVWFSFSGLTAIGANDIVWATFLVGMIVAWRKPTVAALLYGLAVAYKQTPWLLFPFLAIRLWRGNEQDTPLAGRLERVARFAAISGLTFLLVNLPFIAWNPFAWLKGVLSPMSDNLVYLSQGGLAGLTAFGYVNLPKSYYLVATLMVLSVLLYSYWRHYPTLRDAFIIMPAILMWFSYRTLVVYWIYWTLPALAIVIRHPPPVSIPGGKPRWLDTALVSAVGVLLLVAAGLFMAGEAPVVVEPTPPYLTVDGQVVHMAVRVENKGETTLTPRFGVQYDFTAYNPLPWHIESGPLALSPGESALYEIASNGQLTFPASSSAQVVVNDAGGDYALRGVATIGPDRSFLWPDAIPNPEFLFWDSTATAPIFWGLHAEPPGAGAVSYAEKEGHHALELALDGDYPGTKSIALDSLILMPRSPFGIWVYAGTAADRGTQYGIEFLDGERRLTLRFGERYHVEHLSDGHLIIERSVPSGTWTYQQIDLVELYEQAGWDLPAFQPLVYRNVDADFRALTMSLFLSSDGTADGARAYFGPVVQEDFQVDPETLMGETLDDLVGYYVRLSERYLVQRNYGRALAALERARELAPGDPDISARIDEISAHLASIEGLGP
jgi:hypothetical protein